VYSLRYTVCNRSWQVAYGSDGGRKVLRLQSGTTAYNGRVHVKTYVTLYEYVDAGSFFPQLAYCGNTTNSRLQRNLSSPSIRSVALRPRTRWKASLASCSAKNANESSGRGNHGLITHTKEKDGRNTCAKKGVDFYHSGTRLKDAFLRAMLLTSVRNETVRAV
jgi:hypothetical protein